MSKKVKIISNLQKISSEVFKAVIKSLVVGMSEASIAELLMQEFRKRSIQEFWYDVPQIVLIGAERFKVGTTTSDYRLKSPSKNIHLEEGSTVFIDLSPMDSKTKLWGDWASTTVFRPIKKKDDKQLAFLQEIINIQREGIARITSKTTGAEVAKYYLQRFKERGITLLDARNNVGHSVHKGPKNKANRIWLDEKNKDPLGEGFFAVEPGGVRGNLVGRFEDCIYIPRNGNARVLS